MEITNFSIISPINRNNHRLLPKNLRALIVGKSASGKSTLLYNLLLKPWLDYDNLMVFGKSLHQHEYQIIQDYDGMWMKDGNETYGSGLIFGKNSPFRNIPILGWLL